LCVRGGLPTEHQFVIFAQESGRAVIGNLPLEDHLGDRQGQKTRLQLIWDS